MIEPFLDTMWFSYLILPLLIFIARIVDVSFGTIRIIFISKGIRSLAAIFGFVEVLIWLLAISRVIQNFSNPVYYIAYAAGFSCGTYVGMWIESKLAFGQSLVRIITGKDATEFVKFLNDNNYGVTSVVAEGNDGPVRLIYTAVRRSRLPDLFLAIKKYHPGAFFSVENVQDLHEAILTNQESFWKRHHKFGLYKLTRKGK